MLDCRCCAASGASRLERLRPPNLSTAMSDLPDDTPLSNQAALDLIRVEARGMNDQFLFEGAMRGLGDRGFDAAYNSLVARAQAVEDRRKERIANSNAPKTEPAPAIDPDVRASVEKSFPVSTAVKREMEPDGGGNQGPRGVTLGGAGQGEGTRRVEGGGKGHGRWRAADPRGAGWRARD